MKRMRFIAGSVIILSLCLLTACVSYPKEVKKALQRSYKTTFPGYSFRGNPIGNFGVGTIYSYPKVMELEPKEGMPNEWLLAHPSTWYMETITTAEKESLDKKIFAIGSLGSIDLQENISTNLKLNVSIPNISEILAAGADIDYSKGVKVTLKAKEAKNRQLNWSEFVNAIKTNKVKGYVKDDINSGDVIIGCQDIVLYGYCAEISIDQKINPELYAKLNDNVGKILGKDSEFSVEIEKTNSGTFIVTTKDDVVAAVLYKRPLKTVTSDSSNTDKLYFNIPSHQIGFMPLISNVETNDIEKYLEPVIVKTSILEPIETVLNKLAK